MRRDLVVWLKDAIQYEFHLNRIFLGLIVDMILRKSSPINASRKPLLLHRQRLISCALLLMLFLQAVPGVLGAVTLNAIAPSEAEVCNNSTVYVVWANVTASVANNIEIDVKIPVDFSYDANSGYYTIIPPGTRTQKDPSESGQWLNWSGMGNLAAGDKLKIEFNLTPLCDAPSGDLITAYAKYDGGSAGPKDSSTILVKKGLLTVTKEPNVIEASRGDIIYWYINVTNVGTGTAYNVTVNDTPDAGLVLLELCNCPENSLKWHYDRINVSETKWAKARFRVVSCKDLINNASVQWGCEGQVCQETYAKGSVKFVPKEPDLIFEITPNPIEVPYCNNTTVEVNIKNNGLGNATDLQMEFQSPSLLYQITNVTNATYIPANSTFLVGDVRNNSQKKFSFDLKWAFQDCDPAGKSGVFTIYPFYLDDCDEEWFPPASLLRYSMTPGTRPSLSASKTGDASLYVNQTGSYTLTVSYVRGACPLANLTTNTIVDTYPSSFEVVDPSDGTLNASNHTIIWANQDLNESTSWSRTILLKASTDPANCTCGEIVENQLQVNASQDCCGCNLSASASQPIIVECINTTVLSSSNKIADPILQENCREVNFTTTYTFNNTTGLNWSDINFTEHAGIQTFPGGSTTGNAVFVVNNTCENVSQITLGVPKNLSFLDDACGPLGDGDVLNISYNLTTDQTGSFEDWSELCIKGYNSTCPRTCSWEGVSASYAQADYSLRITGIPDVISPCIAFDLTLNLDKNSPDQDPWWLAHFMNITYNDTNYMYNSSVSPIYTGFNDSPSWTPPIPVTWGPGGHLITWTFQDPVNRSGNITLRVEKRCPLDKDAEASLNYTDHCKDLVERETSSSPPLLLKGNLTLDKTPEVIYALDKKASWKIYVTNTGSGTSYNVTVRDFLDKDLNYTGSRIRRCSSCSFKPEPANTTVYSSGPCGPDTVVWRLGNLTPKQQVVIELNSTLCGCKNLNNKVYVAQGCGGVECQNVSSSSRVELVGPKMLVAAYDVGKVDDCGDNITFKIRALNGGTVVVYNASIIEKLPNGLQLNGTPVVTPSNLGFNFTQAGNTLIWWQNKSQNWTPPTLVTIEFNATVTGPCSFIDGSESNVTINYTEPCGRFGPEVKRSVNMNKYKPHLSISKSPSVINANLGGFANWTIDLTSDGDFVAKNVTLYDILPDNAKWHSASPANDSGNGSSGTPLLWNLDDIPVGKTKRVLLNTTVIQCNASKKNTAYVTWSCCSPLPKSTAEATLVTQPIVDAVIDQVIEKLTSCGGLITIDITNNGPKASISNITDIVPEGFIYKKNSALLTSDNSTHNATLVSEPNDYTDTNRTLIWNSTNVDAIYYGETLSIHFHLVNCTDCCDSVKSSSNFIRVNFTDTCDNSFNTSDTKPVTPLEGDLMVRKEPEIQFNGPVSWTIYVTNSGSTTAENVSIIDELGDGFTNVSSNGTKTKDVPYANWTTITWTNQNISVGSTWSTVVTAYANDTCGLNHTNHVTVKGICDSGCVYSKDSNLSRSWGVAVFELDSLETMLRGNTILISSLESLLKNTTLDENGSVMFLDSFDDLGDRMQQGLGNFAGLVRCYWKDLSVEDRVKFTSSFEDLLRRQARILSSNEDLLKRGFCKLDSEDKYSFSKRFQDRIHYEEFLLNKSFDNWLSSQQYLNDTEKQTWLDFLESYEDLIRRQLNLSASFQDLAGFRCDQEYMKLSKTANRTSVNAGDPVEFTFVVNNTNSYDVINLTLYDMLLGTIVDNATLEANENATYTRILKAKCIDCNDCTCNVCNFATACGNVVLDEINRTHGCVGSNEVCLSVKQPGGPVFPG
jgi:uncharacterized repeat protein (TIGR01451 family)